MKFVEPQRPARLRRIKASVSKSDLLHRHSQPIPSTHIYSSPILPIMSSQSTRADWNHGNEFHQSFLVTPDADLSNAIRRSADEGLPKIAVGASEGKFLSLIIRAIGAKRVLEVGLLGGYSTIWMAKALPEDGSIVTCEYSEKHAKVIRRCYPRLWRHELTQGPGCRAELEGCWPPRQGNDQNREGG